jgi:hypothetical protein
MDIILDFVIYLQLALQILLHSQLLVNDARSKTPKLYEGSRIRELDACGLSLEPMLQGFPSILNYFLQLES